MNQKLHRASIPYQWLSDFFIIAIFLSIFYAIWIGSYPLNTPDEGRYSEVAREMVSTGDYITPRLNGVAFLDKPVLYYWLQASAIQLFGLTESALRFWPALLGILSCLIVYLAGRQFFNRRTAIFASIILATSPLYYAASHYANLDIEVASLVSDALLLFMLGMQPNLSNRSRTTLLCLAYVFTALATLTKGLIGFVFPIMIIGTWILILNRWSLLLKMRLLTGIILFLLIAAPWFILVQKANPQFFNFFFITQQFSRFLAKGAFNNKTVVWFYVPIILIGFMPWVVFLFQAIAHHIKLVWKNRKEYSIELFLLLWVAIIFTFFSLPKSKTIGYILPVFPALALITANYLSTFWDKSKALGFYIGSISFIVLCSILTITSIILPFSHMKYMNDNLIPYIATAGAGFFIAGILSYFFLRKNQLTKVFYCILFATIIFLLSLIGSASVLNHKSIKQLAHVIQIESTPQDEIVTYFKYFQDLPIYLQRRITIVANWHTNDIIKYDNWQRELWFNMPYQDTSAWLIEKPTFWQRWEGPKRLFVLMDKGYYVDFQDKIHYKLGELNDVILLSNKPSL